MILRLAIKNAKNHIKEGMIYFFTVIVCVAIFLSFISGKYNSGILSVVELKLNIGEGMELLIKVISAFISVIVGILVVYAGIYFTKRRKYEFGIYLTLGIKKSQIIVILLVEAIMVGLIALVLGIILGLLGTQFMTLFTMKAFDIPLEKFRFALSITAITKTALTFSVIFLISAMINTISVGRLRIINLIYSRQKNEVNSIKNGVIFALGFFLGAIALIRGYHTVLNADLMGGNAPIVVGFALVLGIVGTVLIFLSIGVVIEKILKKINRFYYKGLNMFISKQLSGKIASNSITMAIVTLLLFFSTIMFLTGKSVDTAITDRIKNNVPYEGTSIVGGIGIKNITLSKKLSKELKERGEEADFIEIRTISGGEVFANFNGLGKEKNNIENGIIDIQIIGLSDYNKCRIFQGKEAVNLSKEVYLIALNTDLEGKLIDNIYKESIPIDIGNETLYPVTPVKFSVENSKTPKMHIVVSDEAYKKHRKIAKNMEKIIVNFNTKEKGGHGGNFESSIMYILDNYKKGDIISVFTVKRDNIIEDSLLWRWITNFFLLYIGMLLMIVCAVVLAIKQVTKTEDLRESYRLLKSLGVDDRKINRTLLKQTSIYFIIPLIMALIDMAIGFIAIKDVILVFGNIDVQNSLLSIGIAILAIYGGYFILTYYASKRVVHRRL